MQRTITFFHCDVMSSAPNQIGLFLLPYLKANSCLIYSTLSSLDLLQHYCFLGFYHWLNIWGLDYFSTNVVAPIFYVESHFILHSFFLLFQIPLYYFALIFGISKSTQLSLAHHTNKPLTTYFRPLKQLVNKLPIWQIHFSTCLWPLGLRYWLKDMWVHLLVWL